MQYKNLPEDCILSKVLRLQLLAKVRNQFSDLKNDSFNSQFSGWSHGTQKF